MRLPQALSRRPESRGAFAAVVAAGALAHLPALFNGFVWDDLTFIVWNPVMRDAGNFLALLTKPETWGTGITTPYYRPVTMLSFLADAQLWGAAPAGYHATNVLLHLGVCALLLAVLRRLLAPGAALAAALLFAVHPAAAEPVAYVSARADLICALFLLAAFLAWMRWAETGSRAFLALSALAYGVALFAKITAGLFPAVFVLHGLLLHRRRPRARDLLPFAAVTLGYLAARAAALDMHVWSDQPLLVRVATAGPLIVRYTLMALSPARLRVFHDVPVRTAVDGVAIEAWLLVALAVAFAAVRARRSPVAVLGCAWFFAGIVPVSGLVTLIAPAIAADRYLYVPLAGVAFAAGAALQRLGAAVRRHPARGRLAAAACAAAVLALAATTFSRDRLWRDPVTLWERAARSAPRSQYAVTGLGRAYAMAGRAAEARSTLQRSLALNEANAEVHLNLAHVGLLVDDLDAAKRHSLRTLELDPRCATAYRFLSIVQLQRGREEAALRSAERALELNAFDEVARDLVARLRDDAAPGSPAEN